MKRMNLKSSLLFLTMIIGFSFLFINCSDDEEEIIITKTELTTAISEATSLIEDTQERTAEGQYQRGNQEDLQDVIDIAQTIYDNIDATQTEVDNTVVSLNEAIDDYESKVITPIAPESLVGQWTFDEGTGTIANDFSGNNFNGTLSSGADTWGGTLPTWTTDRYGDANKAISRSGVLYRSSLQYDTKSGRNVYFGMGQCSRNIGKQPFYRTSFMEWF
jgi:hypothetical protein